MSADTINIGLLLAVLGVMILIILLYIAFLILVSRPDSYRPPPIAVRIWSVHTAAESLVRW